VKTRRKPGAKRDRAETEKQLLSAVGRLLETSGFEDVGVNAIAREAGVDKVLIYRYFGKMPDLLRAFALRGEHWPTDAELLGDHPPADPVALAAHVLVRFGRAIRSRPETQSILRHELSEKNPLTDALADAREEQAVRLQTLIGDIGIDAPAVGALLAAGLTYLSLRANTADAYNGVNLRSPEGWERLERAVTLIVSTLSSR
jgi:AcrR family transcriptional regulator